MTNTYLKILVATVGLLLSPSANACSIPQHGPMPICGGLRITPDTDVVMIGATKSGGTTNILLGPSKHSAKQLNIVIGQLKRPVTLVLTHYEAAVLKFSGNVEQVDQVIAMGSQSFGWDHVAVTGINREKLTFLPVLGRNPNLITNCLAPPNACIPRQYFDLGESLLNAIPIDPTVTRLKPDLRVSARGSTVHIPPLPQKVQRTSKPEREFRWPKDWREELALYNRTNDGMTVFPRNALVSPTTITMAPDLPSWAGIPELIEKRHLLPAGNYETDKYLKRFSEEFSKTYRSRFDPDFKFEPEIDFIVTNPILKIPRDLIKADGTPVKFLRLRPYPPKRSKGDTGRYCFFDLGPVSAQPRPGTKGERWRSQCKSYALGKEWGNSPSLSALQLDAAQSLANHAQWNTQLCDLIDIPDQAKLVVLSTQYGRTTVGGARQVDVQVKSKDPVFLFLKGRGALQWHFEVAEESQIAGVVTVNRQKQSVTGLPEGVQFKHFISGDKSLPNKCGNGLLDADPFAGGPAIQLFEMMLQQISGRRIDTLLRKGIIPNPEESTPDVLADYTTFVVE